MFSRQKNKKRAAARVLSFVLTFVLVACFFVTFAKVPDAAAETLSDLQNRYDRLEKEQKEIANQLNALKNDAAAAQKRADILRKQMDATAQQLSLLNDQIAVQDKLILQKEGELQDAKDRIASYKDRCLKRMRASYTSSTVSALSVLMESGSFTDFLLRSEYLRSTAAYDKALLGQLKKDQEQIVSAKKDIEANKAGIVSAKKNAEAKRVALTQQHQSQQESLQALGKDQAALKARQEKITREKKKVNDEIAAKIEQSQGGGEFVGGKWLFPLQFKNWYISSYYGWRTLYGVPDFHTGLDFTGWNIMGAPVLASNAGKVHYTVPYYADHTGYGNHIMIDHGGGNFTLYAHLNSINVQKGQTVKKGQVIGTVGTTGNSTGPHLHFEIFIDRKRRNPYSYLFG